MNLGGLESIMVLINVKVPTAATSAKGKYPVTRTTIVKMPKTAKMPKFFNPKITRVDSVTIAEVVTGRFVF